MSDPADNHDSTSKRNILVALALAVAGLALMVLWNFPSVERGAGNLAHCHLHFRLDPWFGYLPLVIGNTMIMVAMSVLGVALRHRGRTLAVVSAICMLLVGAFWYSYS